VFDEDNIFQPVEKNFSIRHYAIDVIKTVAYQREYRVAAMRGLYLDTMHSYEHT
jgi:hypothetical protein